MAKIKKGPQGAITTAAHKSRRIAAEAARQADNALLRPGRLILRKRGALNRLDRRITAAAGNGALLAKLVAIRAKVNTAYVAAVAGR